MMGWGTRTRPVLGPPIHELRVMLDVARKEREKAQVETALAREMTAVAERQRDAAFDVVKEILLSPCPASATGRCERAHIAYDFLIEQGERDG